MRILVVVDMQKDFVDVAVVAKACAGVTPESHAAALQTMRMCQIEIL